MIKNVDALVQQRATDSQWWPDIDEAVKLFGQANKDKQDKVQNTKP